MLKLFFVLFLLFSASLVQANQDPNPKSLEENKFSNEKSDKQTEEKRDCAPVIFNHKQLFCFLHGVGAFSAVERARSAETKIQDLSENLSLPVSEIKVTESKGHFEIRTSDLVLVSLTEADIENTVEVSPTEYVNKKAEDIKTQIQIDRNKRSPRQIALGSLYSLLSFAGLILSLILLGRIANRVHEAIDIRSASFARLLKFQSYELMTENRILDVLHGAAKAFHIFLSLVLIYFFIPLTLSFFPWTANFAKEIWAYVLHPIEIIWTHLINYLPKLVFIMVASVFTVYLLKLIRFVFIEIEKGSIRIRGFYQEWAMPTYQLIRFSVLALLLIVIFPYLPGSSSPAFQGVTVFLGVLLSFGSSSAIANVVAGVVLTYMRPFRIGDRVKIADTTGDIIEKNLLVTRVRTIKNVDVTVPNSMVLGSHIINYSSAAKTKGLILNPVVTIGYEYKWQDVYSALIEAALRTPHVLKKPEPFVFQNALNDFTISYELNAYTEESLRMAQIYSQLNENIQNVFNERKMEILSPQFHVVRNDETKPRNT